MFIKWFKEISKNDVGAVGGKNANLGEMYSKLTAKGVPVPNGFALTAEAYRTFLKESGIDKKIKKLTNNLDVKNLRLLDHVGKEVRGLIVGAALPERIRQEIVAAYRDLSKDTPNGAAVAVRSSATAEDLPDASFAGQQESYLNVRGEQELLIAVKKCIASLFTDRAISYREAKGFDHFAVALSVGVQQMVRSDLAASGVMFTLDTESGFRGVVLINASFGLGEYVVKGRVVPDQFYIFKEGLKQGKNAIISHRLGTKQVKLTYAATGTRQQKVKISDQRRYCLTDSEVLQLSKWGIIIEEHYGRPMDIEWAKDGVEGKLYIVQARAETVMSRIQGNVIETYKLGKRSPVLAEGTSVGQRIGQGKVRIINSPAHLKKFKAGEVLVTRLTDPDWEPVMRIASAIITEQGGKTSHAAIVSRELGVPCIVGVEKARQVLKPGQTVTVCCAEGEVGRVYSGRLPFEVEKIEIKNIPKTKTKVLMNVGDPERAFALAAIPSDGVGLAREEFIYTNFIKIHPLALIHFKKLKDRAVKATINELTRGYTDKTQYAIDRLAEGVAFIATAFYPNEVVLRFSDFKTNEYATLIGGKDFEPKEENPMLGWRGASRYYDPAFKPAFKIECEAIRKVREEWGLKNVIAMVPFCRTVEEGKKVLETMKEFGLERGKAGLETYVMCEIPANVILAKEFSQIFDGFSIGSNDLTQLTLGVDRDSALVAKVYDENNEAVKKLIREVIKTAHQEKRKVGICGQAPSDHPEFAEFLVQEGIDSISLNPDTVLKTRQRIAEMERKIGQRSLAGKIGTGAKMLALFLAVGLTFVLSGFACQVANDANTAQKIQSAVQSQLVAAEYQMRQELTAEEATRLAKATQMYTEDSFAAFSLGYPAAWRVSHEQNAVIFRDSGGEGFFTVSYEPVDKKLPNLINTSSTMWNGLSALTGEFSSSTTAVPTLEKHLRIFPYGKNSRHVIEFSGDADHFDAILQSVSNFSVPAQS